MTFLKIKIRGIKIDVAKIVPKKTFFLSLVNIFFSVNGIKKIPSKIKKGNFKAKPKSNRCMFCGMRTQKKVEENICVTCFQLREQYDKKDGRK